MILIMLILDFLKMLSRLSAEQFPANKFYETEPFFWLSDGFWIEIYRFSVFETRKNTQLFANPIGPKKVWPPFYNTIRLWSLNELNKIDRFFRSLWFSHCWKSDRKLIGYETWQKNSKKKMERWRVLRCLPRSQLLKPLCWPLDYFIHFNGNLFANLLISFLSKKKWIDSHPRPPPSTLHCIQRNCSYQK